MISRTVRLQVLVFTVIALVGVTFVGANYARLDELFGAGGYLVKVRMPDSGGIFTNAEVTYRGVAIGRVGELHLTADGIEVDLRIEDGSPPVPSDVDVAVANRSAVGEQYLDLRPRRDGGPFLVDGAVVQQSRTTLPLPVEQVVRNLDRLVASVPEEDLRTVVDELYDATQDTGPSLQVLLDSTASFTNLATEHLPQTLRLITDAGPVLTTQIEQSEAIKSFGANAKLIAEQLRTSDADLRRLFSTGPAVARQVTGLIRETGPMLGVLLGNLLTTSTVLLTHKDGVEQLLVVTPAAVSAASNAIGPGSTEVGLSTTFFTPLPCTAGYEGTRYRNGLDTSPAPFNSQARCTR
ncbi:MAG TPA: MCE family protein [Actinophytocola sp.]|uniref:MCE family protein n=1 Tax=Actinophytocola sp. TaxID=1872138 RepID=UPI002DB5DAB4|nr:MCE family protein [Actinophytocola sp.]HEU5470295.1 MCE family protein [Actinophytocola sp.]